MKDNKYLGSCNPKYGNEVTQFSKIDKQQQQKQQQQQQQKSKRSDTADLINSEAKLRLIKQISRVPHSGWECGDPTLRFLDYGLFSFKQRLEFSQAKDPPPNEPL